MAKTRSGKFIEDFKYIIATSDMFTKFYHSFQVELPREFDPAEHFDMVVEAMKKDLFSHSANSFLSDYATLDDLFDELEESYGIKIYHNGKRVYRVMLNFSNGHYHMGLW